MARQKIRSEGVKDQNFRTGGATKYIEAFSLHFSLTIFVIFCKMGGISTSFPPQASNVVKYFYR